MGELDADSCDCPPLLLQLRVLRLRFFKDGDAGVSVFPQSEEVRVSRERSYTGGIGVGALACPRLVMKRFAGLMSRCTMPSP
jgi:hypothetical protein